MNFFRIDRWIALEGDLNRLRFRRAMSAMSVGAVDENWLTRRAGLSSQEVRAFLGALRKAGVLIELPENVLDPISAVPRKRSTRTPGPGSTLSQQLRRWLYRSAWQA
jgi:hypothetical protein